MNSETGTSRGRSLGRSVEGRVTVTGRGDVVVTVPAGLVRLGAVVVAFSALAAIPLVAGSIPPALASGPLGLVVVVTLLAAPVLAPLLAAVLLAWAVA